VNPRHESTFPENPFSTRRVRPGAIPYQYPAGQDAAGLLQRLRKNRWRGQIIGPHGSGKSSLLAALIRAIEHAGRHAVLVELHDGQRRLPQSLRRMPQLAEGAVVVVDGYEQLSPWNRWALRRFCRRRGLGLVVTAHASMGLPDLARTSTSVRVARDLVRRLLAEGPALVSPDDVSRQFVLRRGDLREVFFDLYDLHEQRRSKGPAGRDAPEG
jgi:hypothetical protein